MVRRETVRDDGKQEGRIENGVRGQDRKESRGEVPGRENDWNGRDDGKNRDSFGKRNWIIAFEPLVRALIGLVSIMCSYSWMSTHQGGNNTDEGENLRVSVHVD